MNFTYDFAMINGKIPMIEFLDSLSIKERAKIFASIDKLIELKNHGIQPEGKYEYRSTVFSTTTCGG